ncbi:retron Ec78 anti-phage system effector ATPase PtuA [Aliivibrio fischeri]|uniref:retron Ec78 anti-phage system effector ATPase PtuA n=1 Tax=Aliivibrio fischeri TaxID=668 RepID=UPI0012DA8CF6|nr:retron Ec78 anti-phage system effector ATPase PtuA [Aliivibrio fischeri]MUJ36026.1 AAA family ATPase [Aliivibrio fischeri]
MTKEHKEHKEHSKTIKNLVQKSNNGNLLSMFQLFENYSSGKYVEKKDDTLASQYLNKLNSNLANTKFKLKSIDLHEFRRFRNLKIDFDKNITAIIGDNGAGKTSIAEALAKVLSWFNNNLIKSNTSAKRIIDFDVNVNADDYSEIIGQFEFDKKNKFSLSLAHPIMGYSGDITNKVATSKQIGDMYRLLSENSSISIPLFVFYSVERANLKLPKFSIEKALKDNKHTRFSSLKDGLEASAQLEDFSNRYIELVNLAEGEESEDIKKSKTLIKYLEEIIKKVHPESQPPEDDNLVIQLKSEKENLAQLSDAKSTIFQKSLDLINIAIETLVPDVKNLRVDRSTGQPRILVDNFSNLINITQLSQGQKTLVALTGDLALRLSILNSNAENPLHGHGIVIIDEIELHLHPRWQQEIILGLVNTFPNLQFIVTTHSPQVLSTLDNNCIRQIYLDKQGEPKIKTPQFQTKGVTSASILARIMKTDSTPQKIPEAELVKQFYANVTKGKHEELTKLLERITAHFGEEHPVTKECSETLKVNELKRKYLTIKE